MTDLLESLNQLPPDFFVRKEAFTKTVHRDQYDATDPSSSALSQAGKVILITGASQGIGKEGLAKQFARAGPRAIVLAARNRPKLAVAADEIRSLAPAVKVVSVPTDVTDEASVRALFDTVHAELGHVDVLVNNAGVSLGHTTLEQMDLDEWWRNFDVNVKGTLLTIKYFLRLLAGNPGTIVNISSSAAWNEDHLSAGYCISKLAVVQLCKQMVEIPNLVTVALHPGMVMTDIVPEFMSRFARDTPELVGGTAVWLATDRARFMDGRYMSANWCVEELMAREKEIVAGNLCKVDMSH
ncbi:hypothetical protein A1O3_02489 [Capronia epimyces CBS 606.96]|uniref:Oxidoreductase n=1 Tax=Capronia epimyces CBS 606.96 TaxID=1182542 RepID=W9Y9B9_9EURO|nr:uncharacterized protein A1O3_02489 [Capronia epimyces CBS 606.96]EXJ89422.1 hypothetical protein A1O3_02489 [Capronia epimyces CBS 606.96]